MMGTPRKGKYSGIFAALKNRPGEWEKIAEGQASKSQVTRLRTAFPRAEVTARRNPATGKYDLFARYPMRARAVGKRIVGVIDSGIRVDEYRG